MLRPGKSGGDGRKLLGHLYLEEQIEGGRAWVGGGGEIGRAHV